MVSDWIKLHRSIVDSELWFSERFTRAQAWIDLLLLATYKPRTVFIRGIEMNLHSGDLCSSQLSLAKRWRWDFKTGASFLRLLERREMVEIKTDNVTTVISIKNWSRYQSNGDESGDQNGEQKDTRAETNKKDKKGKKVQENSPLAAAAVKIDDHYAACVRAGARSDAIRSITRLLKQYPEDVLISCVDRYKTNGMTEERQYRIQANNFFGRAERYKDFLEQESSDRNVDQDIVENDPYYQEIKRNKHL